MATKKKTKINKKVSGKTTKKIPAPKYTKIPKSKISSEGKELETKPPVYKKSIGKLGTIKPLKCKERILHAVVGRKGSGKTIETKNIIKKYHKKCPKEKILIIDFYDEYTEYPIIEVKDIRDMKKPSRVLAKNNKEMEYILHLFRGGLLVIEQDCSIENLKNNNSLIGLVTCNRTLDIDVLLTYTSIKQIPQKVFENVSSFRVHRNIESFDLKKYFETNYSVALWLALDIQSTIEDYSSIYVNMEEEKIIGATNEQLFDASVNYHKEMLTDFANRYNGGYGKD